MHPCKGMNFPSNLYNFSTCSIFIHASKLDSNKNKCPYNYHNHKIPFSIIPKHYFKLGVIIFGSVRFLHKKMNQTDIINFKILKPKPNRNRFKPTGFGSVRFGSVFVVQKPVKPKWKSRCPVSTNSKQISVSVENRSAQCPQTTSKSRCPVPTNYKQISMSSVQEHRSTHKLQANYNLIIIIKKKQKPTRCRLQRWTWNGVGILIIKKSSLFLSAQPM